MSKPVPRGARSLSGTAEQGRAVNGEMLALCLDILVHDLGAQVKDGIGSDSCVHVSLMISEILNRVGYRTVVQPVNVAVLPANYFDINQTSAVGSSIFTLGSYNEYLVPVAGGTNIEGWHTAAHAIVMLKQPRLLLDASLDQINTWTGAVQVGLRVPAVVVGRLDKHPLPGEAKRVALADGWVAQYDWLAEDRAVLKRALRPSEWYDQRAEQLRRLVAGASASN